MKSHDADTTDRAGHEPSTFELDVYWASGSPEGSVLAAHVASCARCQEHLEHLEALSAASAASAAASTVAAPPLEGDERNDVTRATVRPRARGYRAWIAPAAGVLALAAGALVYLPSPRPWAGYVATKGTPAIELLVHRQEDTQVWDGRSAVRPGDALALRVACEGLHQVAVAVTTPLDSSADRWVRLSDAPCPAAGELLPFTLVVDAEPGDEDLAVVVSDVALDERALSSAIQRDERSGSIWVTSLHLPKNVSER